MTPRPMRPDEADAVVAFIAGQQAHPERAITYVGTTADGIRAELDGLTPPWSASARVVGDPIEGVVVIEWDEELGRAWIVGPWVGGDAEAWATHADALLDAAVAQAPPTVTRFELSGDVANALLADLAADLGWAASEANHALVADATTVAAWPDDDPASVRPATPDDEAAIAPLHDAEFPDTYATARQLVTDADRITIVTEGGYASGNVHDDGEGFIDFVAVHPDHRGAGVGHRLVTHLTRQLLARSSMGRVALTVQDRRTPARALYEALGFRPDGSFVGYRSWGDR